MKKREARKGCVRSVEQSCDHPRLLLCRFESPCPERVLNGYWCVWCPCGVEDAPADHRANMSLVFIHGLMGDDHPLLPFPLPLPLLYSTPPSSSLPGFCLFPSSSSCPPFSPFPSSTELPSLLSPHSLPSTCPTMSQLSLHPPPAPHHHHHQQSPTHYNFMTPPCPTALPLSYSPQRTVSLTLHTTITATT